MLFALRRALPPRPARPRSWTPGPTPGTDGFQSVQGQIAIGSGGLFGLGPGQSVQKIFYLPEAHTDFILAVIGEELGLAGICGLLALYGMIGVRRAADREGRDAAPTPSCSPPALTSLILCQALLNVYTVLGLAPLTGVPLPFISSGSTLADRAAERDGPAAQRGARRHRAARGQDPRAAEGGAMSAPRIVIAAGGTAGHVVPAIAVADALRAEGAEVSFVGGERAEAELVPAAGYPLDPIRVEGISPLEPAQGRRAPCCKAGAALRDRARDPARAAQADAVLGGGGYVAGPGRPRRGRCAASRSC